MRPAGPAWSRQPGPGSGRLAGRAQAGVRVTAVRSDDLVPRRAGRVLVVDDDNRVLLLHGFDPANPEHPFWFTVGGGADAGESLAAAAARELREEVGLSVEISALGEPVWQRVTEFGFDGTRYRQDEEYFLLRVRPFRVSLAGLDQLEQDTVDAYRWWDPAELESSGEEFHPPDLPRLLRELG
jgi:8-oxo-dGTP pyrophosphatase MutT (NUDIX family)